MLRDKLKDLAYYDDRISFKTECIEKYLEGIHSDGVYTNEVKMKMAFRLVSNSMYLLHQKYSRGNNLATLKTDLDNALKYRQWQKNYADALSDNEQADRIQWEEFNDDDDLRRTIIWFAFAVCLDMGKDYYSDALALIANHGQDAILDNIAVSMGDIAREVACAPLFKKRFGKLYAIIAAPHEQRPALVKDYLDAWYKLEGSPDYHLMDTDAYIGYWSWGSALVVKLYNIDDSSFIEHEYYPKDLVHWQN